MILFACPACSIVFQALPDADQFLCPNGQCGQQMRRPSASSATALAGPAPTVVSVPPFRSLDRVRLLRVRVWAAAVRDREGEFADAPPEASGLARTLCALLDTRGHTAAENARDAIDASLATLVGLLVLAGVPWLPETQGRA